jgi:deazaflavin-dependent oxidoreductase (nitroreductase family)
MLDTPRFTQGQLSGLRRIFHRMNHLMVFMWKIGLGGMLNAWPAVGGRIMVIKHRGRRSGKVYLTPVNYAIVNDEIYCTAGFGEKTDWYRNVLANPTVELWLPQGRRRAQGSDASASPERVQLLRQVLIASGFAGPLFGVDPRKLADNQLAEIARDYRLVHFSMEA